MLTVQEVQNSSSRISHSQIPTAHAAVWYSVGLAIVRSQVQI